MTSRQAISLQLSKPRGPDSRAALVLEQEPWDADIGKVTKANMINFLGKMLYGNDAEEDWGDGGEADCGMSDGAAGITVYAYPSPADLRYQIAATHGDLGDRTVQEMTRLETLHLSMEDEAATEYPAVELLDAAAQGNLYDGSGAIVPLPAITIDGDRIKLSRKVYGSVSVLYRMLRHQYSLNIPPRDLQLTAENYYSSVVYAWWDGDGTWLEIEPPPGAEEHADEDDECGWHGGTGDDTPADPTKRPVAAGADRAVGIDYCKGEKTSDSIFPWVIWETDEQ